MSSSPIHKRQLLNFLTVYVFVQFPENVVILHLVKFKYFAYILKIFFARDHRLARRIYFMHDFFIRVILLNLVHT